MRERKREKKVVFRIVPDSFFQNNKRLKDSKMKFGKAESGWIRMLIVRRVQNDDNTVY